MPNLLNSVKKPNFIVQNARSIPPIPYTLRPAIASQEIIDIFKKYITQDFQKKNASAQESSVNICVLNF